MLNDRIDILLSGLGARVSDIAACSDMGIANISRLKSGARAPKKYSTTIDKLLCGVLQHCANEGKADTLDEIIAYQSGDKKEVLRNWLYPEVAESFADFASFPSKLSAAMRLADISGARLAKLTNTDASYISRIKSGSRTPKANHELYEGISRALFDEIADGGRLTELKKLIHSDRDMADADLYYEFRNWLCDLKTNDNVIQSLLNSIDKTEFSAEFPFDVENLDLSYRQSEVYCDDSGLQEASIRFLTEVVNSDAKEIYLYSDRNIDWMTKDKAFGAKWAYLMYQVVMKGVNIKIIHNIDRKVSDMVNAIQSWLPLYISCRIEPYYSGTKKGNRFTHTLFVCPEVACVSAFNLPDNDRALFNYYTDRERIEYGKYLFDGLMHKSMPLVHMKRNTATQTDGVNHTGFENISIDTDGVSVTVSRFKEPKVSFVILNQLLCDAIRAYCADSQK